jgi:hypothetical protein
MYLKFTYVDAKTGIPCTEAPMRRGPAMPDIKGLQFHFGDQRNWPTNTPVFIGTCDDDADTTVAGFIEAITEEQYQQEQVLENDAQAQRVREQRDAMLSSSDWTQAEDIPESVVAGIDKEAWATYRQALRDVPEQEGFPWNVQWPEQP